MHSRAAGRCRVRKPVVPAWVVRQSQVVRTYDFAAEHLGIEGQPCPPAENKLLCDFARRNRPRCGIIRDSLPEAGSFVQPLLRPWLTHYSPEVYVGTEHPALDRTSCERG